MQEENDFVRKLLEMWESLERMGRTDRRNPARPGMYKPEEILKYLRSVTDENPGWLGYRGDYTTQFYNVLQGL